MSPLEVTRREPREITRRELLELGLAAGLAAGAGHAGAPEDDAVATRSAEAAAAASRARGAEAVEARNVVFMISDGMSLGVVSLAEAFSRAVRGRGTQWYKLLGDPGAALGLLETHSLSSLVTDSAAAASAWGSGTLVFNGALNVAPDGTRLTPLAPLLRDVGRRVGLVTTTRITHATPAGFAAIQPSREAEDEIAPQYLDVVDVLLGGGRQHYDPARRADHRDLLAEHAARGYEIWDHRRQVAARPALRRVLGLFADSHLPFTLDERNRAEEARRVPALAEMTRAALDILAADGGGFLLQVEGGRVDHAAHANDAATMLWDQLAFDDALGVVRAFAAEHADTLVIVTADHGNSNPGLNGMGDNYSASGPCLERLAGARASFEVLGGRCAKEGLSADDVREMLRDATGIAVTAEEAAAVRAAAIGTVPVALSRQHASLAGVLGQVLGNHNGIGWTGTSHTEDPVVVSAVGPGAGRLAGLHPHPRAFECVAAVTGIRHRNPQMSPEEARKHLTMAPRITRPDWA